MRASRNRDAAPQRVPAWRSRVLLAFLLTCFMVLAGRSLYLQGLNHDFLQQKGESRYTRVIDVVATRGRIVDRNDEPLAVSTPVESVAASPADIAADSTQLARLARLLGMKRSELERRLSDRPREFVYLKRQLAPEDAARVVALGVPGVFLQREYRRYYPAGEVAAQLVGFTNVDDRGQEAAELAFDETLRGQPGSRRVIKDRLGQIVEDVESIRTPRDGATLTLSVDARLQYLAYRELKSAVTAHQAKAGSIVMLDVATGEVLAMANVPSFNPNNRGKLDPARTRNRAVTDVFEPGSTLKPFTVAAALEGGDVKPGSVIETAPGQLSIGNRVIHDAHPQGALTVGQVLQKSSNVGTAKMALKMKPEELWTLFNQVGFGTVPGSGFPGEVSGKLRAPATWRPIEHATISYGHGVSVSLLQLARAYLIFATDGELKPLALTRQQLPQESSQVISARTARQVRHMLETVVQPGGTATRARIPGYRVAGKTGTTHKLVAGSYAADRYISSFVGFAPASRPRLIVAVMIDEPEPGEHFGGVVAAPVFARVMAGGLRLLAVEHDAPLEEPAAVTADAPIIKEDV